MKKKLFFIALLFFITGTALAQKITVTGTVTGSIDNLTMPGVSVRVSGSTIGTSTNKDGYFTISAPSAAELVFSYTGYKTQTVPVSGKTVINVVLVSDISQLNGLWLLVPAPPGA